MRVILVRDSEEEIMKFVDDLKLSIKVCVTNVQSIENEFELDLEAKNLMKRKKNSRERRGKKEILSNVVVESVDHESEVREIESSVDKMSRE